MMDLRALGSVDGMLESISVVQLAEALLDKLQKQAASLSMDLIVELTKIVTHSLTVIRGAHNSLASVNKLPLDVFSIILQLVSNSLYSLADYRTWDVYELPPWLSPYVEPYSIIDLTHVCRHWRNVALDLPSLWANVADSSCDKPVLRTLIDRSRMALLNVFMENYPLPFVTRLMTSDGHRVRSVWWEGHCNEHALQLFNFPAPAIQSLVLMEFGKLKDTPIVPVLLFHGNAPRIRQLFLQRLSWLPSNEFSSLTQLHLASYSGPGLSSAVLTLLGRTPNLRDLILSHLRDLSVQPESRVIPLMHLRTFLYRENSAGVAPIFQHLTLGVETALKIYYLQPSEVAVPCGLSPLPVAQSITKIAILQWTNSQWMDMSSVLAVGPQSGVDIGMFEPQSQQMVDAMFELVRDELPCVQVRELWIMEIRCALSSRHADLATMLRCMPNLEKMVVLEENLTQIVHALLWSNQLPDPSSPRKPMTLHIIIHRVDDDLETFMFHIPQLIGLGITHLTIGLLRGRTCLRLKHRPGLFEEFGFQSVVYVHHQELPIMDMPTACTTSQHLHWLSWEKIWRDLDSEL
ncbi:hypothetical protein BKA93DRAFT_811997 [Sparassis latifolia]